MNVSRAIITCRSRKVIPESAVSYPIHASGQPLRMPIACIAAIENPKTSAGVHHSQRLRISRNTPTTQPPMM